MTSSRLLVGVASLMLAVLIVSIHPIKGSALDNGCYEMLGLACSVPLLPPDNHPKMVLTHEHKAMIEGDRRLREKNYGDAIAKYREALVYCRTNCGFIKKSIAYAKRDREVDRGTRLWKQQDWSGAISAYKKALRYCRSNMDCDFLHYNIDLAQRNRESIRGDQLFSHDRYRDAITAYKKALGYCHSDMDCDYLHRNIALAQRKRERDLREVGK